jgi:hypothetical protein
VVGLSIRIERIRVYNLNVNKLHNYAVEQTRSQSRGWPRYTNLSGEARILSWSCAHDVRHRTIVIEMPVTHDEICGYLVVRNAHRYPFHGPGSPKRRADRRRLCYCGIDRDAWQDIMEGFYEGILPRRIHEIMRSIEEPDLTGLCLCRDLNDATAVADYVNRHSAEAEIIAVWSESIAARQGTVPVCPGNLQPLGIDVVATGEWSLIAAGVFSAESPLTAWSDRLNAYGLFDDERDCVEFAAAYRQAAVADEVEPTADHPALPIDFIHVFGVQPG